MAGNKACKYFLLCIIIISLILEEIFGWKTNSYKLRQVRFVISP